MTNDICVKSSMAIQPYKVVSTHSHEISGCKIISRLINSRAPRRVVINGYFQSDLSTLEFNDGEQLKYFHSIILRLQQ